MKRGALARYLSGLGYGSRREVVRMMQNGRVTTRDGSRLEPDDAVDHDDILVAGEPLDPAPDVVVMLNKPIGYVCSTSDVNPVVYELLPPRFRMRDPIIAPIGRLDRDTSGMLLLTDDGPLNHRITSPRTHVEKMYEVTVAEDLRGDEAAAFASGELLLRGEVTPLRPARLEVLDARHARVTVAEGRYHQVRRMFAAVGNHVVALHRSSVAGLQLAGLGPGEWRVLAPEEAQSLRSGSSSP